MPDVRSTLLGVGAVASVTLAIYAWPRKNIVPLPKSPKAYPLIGNLLSMPQTREHLGFIELGKQLNSDIFSLSMFGIVIVVLNSVDDAINLLDKRSGIYSDRTVPPMIADPSLMHWPDFLSLLRYGDGWRKTRRLIHPWLHKKASESFHESQQLEARLLLQRLVQRTKSLDDSEEVYGEFFKTLAGTLMRSIYGYDLQSVDDPMLVGIQQSIENLAKAALPSNFLVNVFPALRHVPEWFPGAGWKKTAREWRAQQQKAVSDAYNWTKSRLESDPMPCIVASLIPHAEQLGLTAKEIDEYVSQIAVGLFGAGTETTANLLLVFTAAMVLYPEAQAKAQREIDAVIGRDRLPTVEDKSELPYTNCLIQEVMRWCPVVPNGVPHACFQDDIYQGFQIPKGALVISNIWAMSRDERVYADPETFDPDRFLDPSVPPCPVFGFGRRQCPGIHFAQTSAFIVIASILATFTFTAAEDGPKPELRTDDSTVFHLKPFRFNIVPRSPQHVDLINAGA